MADLDPVKNFIKLTLSGTYGSTDTSLNVVSGGSNLPSPSFNATVFNSTDYSDPSDDPNAEIVRVTAISGDSLTVIRGEEDTLASPKNLAGKTYVLILGITAKMIADIQANLQQPWKLVNVDGTIDGVNTTFTLHGGIVPFDPNSMHLRLGRQEQEQGLDYTPSGITISYITPPPADLAGQPHIAQYQ